MPFIKVPPYLLTPRYQVRFRGGFLDRMSIEMEGFSPPDEHWARCPEISMVEFLGKGTAGPGFIPGPPDADPEMEWLVYRLESRHPHTMRYDQPEWLYVFAGVAKASGAA